jgi:hypothetical protein
MLVAHVAPFGHPAGTDPERFLLVAPYEPDPRRWRRLPWTNAYEPGSRHEIITAHEATRRSADGQTPVVFDGEVTVKTYRDVLAEYRTHPEAKSLGPDDNPCHRATIGLLSRRPVKVAAIHHIGKESNRIEEAMSGLFTDLDDVLAEYHDPARDPFQRLVVPVLRELPVAQVAAGARVSARTVKRARAQQAEKAVWIATNERGDQCGHHHSLARPVNALLQANGTPLPAHVRGAPRLRQARNLDQRTSARPGPPGAHR